MAAGMIQETGQDGGLQTCTPYKRPSLIQALFGRMSTEVDVGKKSAHSKDHKSTEEDILYETDDALKVNCFGNFRSKKYLHFFIYPQF